MVDCCMLNLSLGLEDEQPTVNLAHGADESTPLKPAVLGLLGGV